MLKKLLNKKENKGYISIEVIIIAAIMLALFGFLFFRFAWKANEIKDSTLIGMEEAVDKITDPSSENGDSWLDIIDDGDSLLGQNNTLVAKSFVLEKSLNQEQETMITLDRLTKIKRIKTSNGGEIEIISIKGDNVVLKVISGEPTESIVVSGEYISYDEKTITDYDSSNYDVDGYTGTLTQYIASGEESKSTIVTETKIFTSKNDVNDTTEYNIAGYKGTLEKAGSLEEILISGTASHSKTVTNQNTSNYSDSEGYTGTLTAYVVSGEAPIEKTVNENRISSSNNFVDTITYNSGGYTGTLSKSGSASSQLISGSAGGNKTVSAQNSANYSDSEGYTGTLTQYVHSGLAPVSKTVSQSQKNSNNNFSATMTYNDGTYSGTLNKNGSPTAILVSGSASQSKYVSGQTSSWYNDGVYSGYLSSYVYSGSEAAYYQSVRQSWSDTVGYRCQASGNGIEYSNSFPSSRYYDDGVYYGIMYLQSTSFTGSTGIYLECNGFNYGHYYVDNYTLYYAGELTKRDNRVYRYQGTVYTADTRVYEYTQNYSGTVSTPDTRVYKYQGIVTKPDTRVYEYTQNYSGKVSTPDTRVYKYQGTVTKPDTRVYEYKQSYTGTVSTPDTRVYKYQGIVARPESDTRVYEHYYQYDIDVEYYERKDK